MKEMNIPVGISDFTKLIQNDFYYIDKTGLIQELLTRDKFEVILFTRPRRFGKTLAMSMLPAFFDIRKDSRKLFQGLKIFQNKELCVVRNNQASQAEIKNAFVLILRMMNAYYGKPAVFLLDEYDVPIAKAESKGYYEQMMEVISALLGTALKDNSSLCFAVITGCLRITKESVFTGTNNFVVDTISDCRYNEYFGFTDDEVQNIWSLLYLTGYLTKKGTVTGSKKVYLKIPNAEVRDIFQKSVIEWFNDKSVKSDRHLLFLALWNMDAERLTELLSDLLFSTISYHDYAESYYHAFLIGLFSSAGYIVESNFENGFGRSDVVVKDRQNRKAAVIEVKISDSVDRMERDCQKALKQIEENQYAIGIEKEGFKMVIRYGIAFYWKQCMVLAEN